MHLAGLIGFIAVGLSLGMLGGGGSILAVPILVQIFGLPADRAVAMSLPVVGAASAAGAFSRWRAGQVKLRTAGVFAAAAMFTSFLAARLGSEIPDGPRLALFTTVMLIAALLMWRRAMRTPSTGDIVPQVDGLALPKLIPAALAVGALTGLVGVGGGFLIVPALAAVLGLPIAEATATSLAVIALNTVAASAGWWGKTDINLNLTVQVTIAALVGMMIGTKLAPKVAARSLTKGFAGFLIVVAIWMIVKQ